MDRENKCPKSRTNDLYMEQTYSTADDRAYQPFNLHDVFAQNGVDKILKGASKYSQGAYDATKTARPSLWYKPAYFFDTECETSDQLTREDLLKIFRDNIKTPI